MAFRVLAGLIGAFFLLQAFQWLVAPADSAAALGMPLLDGIARSTQIGDLSAFFLCVGGMSALGAYQSRGVWLRPAGALLGAAALMRTLAWWLQGADFALTFICIEVVFATILFFCAARLDAA